MLNDMITRQWISGMAFSEQKSVKERDQNATCTMYLTHAEGKRTLVARAERKQEL